MAHSETSSPGSYYQGLTYRVDRIRERLVQHYGSSGLILGVELIADDLNASSVGPPMPYPVLWVETEHTFRRGAVRIDKTLIPNIDVARRGMAEDNIADLQLWIRYRVLRRLCNAFTRSGDRLYNEVSRSVRTIALSLATIIGAEQTQSFLASTSRVANGVAANSIFLIRESQFLSVSVMQILFSRVIG
jgi:hypothetical protein